ncbi:hypothetical protein [Haloarcula onubensis]|uniref:Uncharacterized protein n=1 Tax=Haloarcula onubensis TaxID=2950539 RepID=A0ABU2FSE4_9EURY|nr:hypothetical protein [Halomicroarcula sp. S3CR25-11]MDS0283681.1 hypothetical protein [Halomicroarcula sp. S3CR25-11]
MNRRDLLATVGIAAASAGCLSPSDSGPQSDTGTPTDTRPRTDTPATPGVPQAGDEFAGAACPSFPAPDRTVCHHTAGADAEVVLAAEPELFDPERGDDTVESLSFTLYNYSEWTVSCNPDDWAIHEHAGGTWSFVAPQGPIREPLHVLAPGDSLRWELPEMTHPSPGGDDTYRVDTALEAGVYAFSVTGTYGERGLTETPSGEPPAETAFVALFRLGSAIGGAGASATARTDAPGE